MNADLAIVLALLAAAIAMFAVGRPRMDAVALLMLTVLPLTGVIDMNESLAGFADGNVVLIATLFVIGEGLVRTGVAQGMGDLLLERAGSSDARLLVLLMLFVGALGAVMSSTGVVAIFIPVVLRVAQTLGASPSKLMMPLSVAALSSGMLTLVATAPNLVISSELVRHGFAGFHFFSFTPIGLVVLGMSVFYMLFARRWLGSTSTGDILSLSRPTFDEWIGKYQLTAREMRLRVTANSPLVGLPLKAANFRRNAGLNILGIERVPERPRPLPRALPRGFEAPIEVIEVTSGTPLQVGDILLADHFNPDCNVTAALEQWQLESLPATGAFFSDRSQHLGMAEVLVGPDSSLIGRTVRQARLRSRLGLTVLGLRRGGTAQPLGHLQEPLQVGDTLLVVGRWTRIEALRLDPDDLVLLQLPTEREDVLPAAGKAPQALAVLALVVGLMVSGVVPNVQAGLIGALLLGLLGCVDFTSAYGAIHLKSLVLIVGMMPFSLALQRTGGVDLAAGALAAMAEGSGPRVLLAALFALTSMLGLFVSNTATAVLMAPVAIAVAAELGASPYPFAMTVALGASAAFMTPVSSPVNTLVVEPGNYTMGDFVKVGVPLTALVLIVTVLLVPVLFPF